MKSQKNNRKNLKKQDVISRFIFSKSLKKVQKDQKSQKFIEFDHGWEPRQLQEIAMLYA